MIFINYSHPLTSEQEAQLAALLGAAPERMIEVPSQFDQSQDFQPQILALLEQTKLTPGEWQTSPMVINLPSLAPIAAMLLAELHGRMGYFPTILRLRPVPGSTPSRFELAELINLQAIRETARTRRLQEG